KLQARLQLADDPAFHGDTTLSLRIAPRPPPLRMPVVMWGVGADRVTRELDRLTDLGFTHCLGLGADYETIWKAGAPTEATKPELVAEHRRMLDAALGHNFGIVASLSPVHSLIESHRDLLRVGPDGKTHDAKRPDICGLTPGLDQFCYNV